MSGVFCGNCYENCRKIPQNHQCTGLPEVFYNKADAFSEGLQQLLINKINI